MSVELHGGLRHSRHLIDDESQIGECRRAAAALAQTLDFDPTAAGRVAIAATELATNLVRHAGGGEVLMQPVFQPGRASVELLAIDRGRGMENVERCLTDGYSTGGTAGTGLGAVRRLAAEFDIYSAPGEGTVVLARVVCGAVAAPRAAMRFGAINVALAGESECGDSWRLATNEDVTAIMVADGLGHGILAAEAARSTMVAFEAGPFDPPVTILQRAHRAAAGTRGAAGACAQMALPQRRLLYAGVGNIAGSIASPERSQGLVSHNGTLGLTVTRVQQFEYQGAPHSFLVMHSDGLSARWDLKARPGLMQRHPAVIAAVLYRDHARGRDDSTVVVIAI
jgi:anti-sigma regulatory factor (Ser/Thr protein kinase)